MEVFCDFKQLDPCRSKLTSKERGMTADQASIYYR